MSDAILKSFQQPDLEKRLATFSADGADKLDFGVIGFDNEILVQVYNEFESKASGLSPHRVLGLPLFTVVAPCMNNYLVAQRFEDALESGVALDETIAYVLTLRMRPVKVSLRLIATPGAAMRYLIVDRPS